MYIPLAETVDQKLAEKMKKALKEVNLRIEKTI